MLASRCSVWYVGVAVALALPEPGRMRHSKKEREDVRGYIVLALSNVSLFPFPDAAILKTDRAVGFSLTVHPVMPLQAPSWQTRTS